MNVLTSQRVAVSVALAAGLMSVCGAHGRPPPRGDAVTVSGCVLHGAHFGPAQASVTVLMPDRGRQRAVRSDAAGRFAVSVPQHTRLVLTVAPMPTLTALPEPSSQTLHLTTGGVDVSADGCLVVW